ncbi:MAG TPA: gluconokinase [Myxococcota bacterium]|nr:gluconokinase [Myxococcota bacterium]
MVIVTMGVSGAGKSTLGRALARKLGFHFEEGDDWHDPTSVEKMRRGESLSDEDRQPWLERLNRAIREWVASKRGVVLACSALRRSHRQVLRSGLPDPTQLRFVFLDGSREEIERRLRARAGHFMPVALLSSQLETLEPPDPGEAIRLRVGTPVDRAVEAAIDELGSC